MLYFSNKEKSYDRMVFTLKLWLVFLLRLYIDGNIIQDFLDPTNMRLSMGSLINSEFFDQRKLNEE